MAADSKVAEYSEQSDEDNEILHWQWLQMKQINNNNDHLKIIQTIPEQHNGKAWKKRGTSHILWKVLM